MIQHLHILHLSRREDRMQLLLRHLEWNKVPYTMWEGFDEPENVKQAITRGYKKIIQYAKDNNLQSINTAEDDCCFTHKDSYKYFNSQIKKEYDLTFGVVYSATLNEDFRILNGMSGSHTLCNTNSSMYDVILNLPDDIHIDRGLGEMAFKYNYHVVPEYCCYQSGGYSDNLKRKMTYEAYLDGKKLYGVD